MQTVFPRPLFPLPQPGLKGLIQTSKELMFSRVQFSNIIAHSIYLLCHYFTFTGQLESELAEFKHAFADLYSELQEPI